MAIHDVNVTRGIRASHLGERTCLSCPLKKRRSSRLAWASLATCSTKLVSENLQLQMLVRARLAYICTGPEVQRLDEAALFAYRHAVPKVGHEFWPVRFHVPSGYALDRCCL